MENNNAHDYINTSSRKSRNHNLFPYHSVSSIKKGVINLKKKHKKDISTFHSTTLGIKTNQSIIITEPNEEIRKEYKPPVSSEKNYNSKFFYQSLSSTFRKNDSVNLFLDKTRNIRRMKVALSYQNNQIKSKEEASGNEYEQVDEIIETIGENKVFLENKFITCYDKYVLSIIKQIDYEKYSLSKLQEENLLLKSANNKIDILIRKGQQDLELLREYKVFLVCVKERQSLKEFRRLAEKQELTGPRIKRFTRMNSTRRFTHHDLITERINTEPEQFATEFSHIDKDILDLLRRYADNQLQLNSLKSDLNKKKNIICEEDDSLNPSEAKLIKERYKNENSRNEQLRKQKEIYSGYKFKPIVSYQQLLDLYYMLKDEFPKRSTSTDKRSVDILALAEKAMNFLVDKYQMYISNEKHKKLVKELDKDNERRNRARLVERKNKAYIMSTQSRGEQELEKLIIHNSISKRKIAPRFRPSSHRPILKPTVSLDHEFDKFIMY
jgi:hypothetical protein